MNTLAKAVDILRLFADPTRVRLAHLLDSNELSVAEITQISDLPQSRVSTPAACADIPEFVVRNIGTLKIIQVFCPQTRVG